MLKKVFNYLAGNPKHQYTLGSLVSSGEATPPLSVELNRGGRLLERAVTLTGVFFGVAAFVAAPVAAAAIPALVGVAALSKGAGFATGFLADIGLRRATGQ